MSAAQVTTNHTEEMVDDVTKAEPAPEGSESAPGDDAAAGGTTPAQLPQLANTQQKDVVMADAPTDQASSPAPAPHVPSPAPHRTTTPAHGSRAASAHPDAGFSMPSEAPPHGDPTRRYLNTRVTGVLLEGMKQIAKDQPSDPLRVLGEYFLQRSRELEGTQ